MKKTGLTVSALTAAGLLATPYWLGVQAEQMFDGIVQQVSRQLPHARLVTSDYRRGWFGSEARTRLLSVSVPASAATAEAGAPAADRPVEESLAVIEHRISHGPFPIDLLGEEGFLEPLLVFVRSSIQAGAAAQQALNANLGVEPPPLQMRSTLGLQGADTARVRELFGDSSPLQVDTKIALDGSGESRLTVPAFVHPLVEHGDELSWDGLTGSVRFDAGFRTLGLDLQAPLLSVKEADGSTLQLVGTHVQSDSRQTDDGLWLGQSRARADLLELSQMEDGGGDARFEGLRFGFSLNSATAPTQAGTAPGGSPEGGQGVAVEAEETLTAKLQLGIDAARTVAPEVGELEFATALEVTVAGLDKAALAHLQAISGQYPADQWVEGEGMPAPVEAAFVELATKTLGHSPSLSVDRFSLKLPEGELVASLRLALDGAKVTSGKDIAQVLTAIRGEASLELPTEVLRRLIAKQKRAELLQSREQGIVDLNDELIDLFARQHAKQQARQLLDGGMLIEEQGIAKTHAVFEQGRLTVNGRPIPLPMPSDGP